jgi:hypothetical protein
MAGVGKAKSVHLLVLRRYTRLLAAIIERIKFSLGHQSDANFVWLKAPKPKLSQNEPLLRN